MEKRYGPAEWELVQAYLNDARFDFPDKPGDYLRGGRCPNCGKKELWISKSHPWVLRCSRLNNCGYEETSRELYPELFDNYTRRHPPTPENPKATADAYMSHNRGFPLETVGDWYEQGHHRDRESGITYETVRFWLDPERTRYWERLIDRKKGDGQRVHFGGKRKTDGTVVRGEWWTPPGQEIHVGDEVYLVEGIFHAIAFHLSGYKVAALLMAGNFPEEHIAPYLGWSIKWRIALDDDKAGHKYMRSHREKLKGLNESAECVLSGTSKDWDDIYRLQKLNDQFLREALFRGRLFAAETITRKCWVFHQWRALRVFVLPFEGKLYSCEVGDTLAAALVHDGITIAHPNSFELFGAHSSIVPISNCVPEFLYTERNRLTAEIAYFFRVEYSSNQPAVQIALSGSAIESAPSFNKALLVTAGSATFDGKPSHYKIIRERWFKRKSLEVETVPFVGYDKTTGAYLFQTFGFYQGREMTPNEHGFFEQPKPIKTGFRGFSIARGSDDFKTDWFPDFLKVFHWNGVMCLTYWFGSLFAEQIRGLQKSFPFLEITGEHGTGKSTVIEFLWKLIGRDDYEGFDPNKASFPARARSFSQVSNMPVVLIESDREAGGAKARMFDFEELKTAYNGRAIRSLGVFNRGNDTEEPPFRGSIVIAQNAEVDGTPALLSRIIQCHFTSRHFNEETRRLAPRFESATVDEMAGFLGRCLKKEAEILKTYRERLPVYQEFFSGKDVKDQRIIKNHATLMALAEAMALAVPELTQERLDQLAEHVYLRAVDRQQRLNADHPIVQGFWETYELLNVQMRYASEGYAGREEEILNHSHDEGIIAINLKHFDQVCAEHKVERIPTAELKKYLSGSKTHKFLEQKNVKSKILQKTLWCWVFRAGKEGRS
jgi:hypothetical protein